jgi:hypothetical protein
MPNKIVEDLIQRVIKIETRLDINTWLTGIILVALLSKIVAEWFSKH